MAWFRPAQEKPVPRDEMFSVWGLDDAADSALQDFLAKLWGKTLTSDDLLTITLRGDGIGRGPSEVEGAVALAAHKYVLGASKFSDTFLLPHDSQDKRILNLEPLPDPPIAGRTIRVTLSADRTEWEFEGGRKATLRYKL